MVPHYWRKSPTYQLCFPVSFVISKGEWDIFNELHITGCVFFYKQCSLLYILKAYFHKESKKAENWKDGKQRIQDKYSFKYNIYIDV